MNTNDTEIASHREVLGNPSVFDGAKALLTSPELNSGDIDVALTAMKTAKEQPIIKPKGDKVFWLDKTLAYEERDVIFNYYSNCKISEKITYE